MKTKIFVKAGPHGISIHKNKIGNWIAFSVRCENFFKHAIDATYTRVDECEFLIVDDEDHVIDRFVCDDGFESAFRKIIAVLDVTL